jgi:hypothetical protein
MSAAAVAAKEYRFRRNVELLEKDDESDAASGTDGGPLFMTELRIREL